VRLDEEIKRRTRVVRIFPNDAAITGRSGSGATSQGFTDTWG